MTAMMTWLRRFRERSRAVSAAGYQDSSLVDLVVRKTAALDAAGRIDDIQAGETLLPTIAGVAAARSDGPLRVIDFGGAAGLHYRVAKQAMPRQPFRWAVIETPEMTTAAAGLATPEMRFFSNLQSGIDWLGTVQLMHCVSALQYVPAPEELLRQLLTLGADTLLWAKLMLGDRRETFVQSSFLRDNGPGPLPPGIADRTVTYTAIKMRRGEFIGMHQNFGYRLAWKAKESDTYLFFKEVSS